MRLAIKKSAASIDLDELPSGSLAVVGCFFLRCALRKAREGAVILEIHLGLRPGKDYDQREDKAHSQTPRRRDALSVCTPEANHREQSQREIGCDAQPKHGKARQTSDAKKEGNSESVFCTDAKEWHKHASQSRAAHE